MFGSMKMRHPVHLFTLYTFRVILHFQAFYKCIKIWSLIVVNERGKKHTHTHTRVYNKNILLLFRFFGCIKTFGSLAANVTYVTAIT